MLVLLSSGATRRYRDDIVRALALPAGAELQFRYDRRYIDSELLKEIDTSELRNERAIILYLWSDKDQLQTGYVPCRFVTVIGAESVGSSYIVRLRIESFVADFDDAKLRSDLSSEEDALLPKWRATTGAGATLDGKFFFRIHSSLSCVPTDSLTAFEATAIALSHYKDFAGAQSKVFYSVRRLVIVNQRNVSLSECPIASLVAGTYDLSSGQQYEMEIYCFLPPGAETRSAKLRIASDVEAVSFPLGHTRDIDSRYDLKRFPLRVEQQTGSVAAGLHIYLTDIESEDKSYSDILLPVFFRGSLLLAAARVAVIGIGASGPAMIAASSAGKLNLGIALLMLLFGCVAGLGIHFFKMFTLVQTTNIDTISCWRHSEARCKPYTSSDLFDYLSKAADAC